MVQMNDVRMVYGNTEAEALSGVSFTINEGEFVFLVGPSGSGKTTIIKLITGELSPTSGQITVNGFDMQGIKRRKLPKLRRTLGVIFQDFRLIDKMTVYENVAFAMRVVGASNKEIRRRVPQVLELVGLVDREKRYPAELSGGEQQRVAIARALANNPDILLSDEATSALDPNTTKSILKLLRQLHDTLGLTIVIITHQMSVVKQICNKVAVIDHGTIVEEGRLFDIFVNPQAPLTKSFVATTSNLDKVNDLIEEHSPLVSVGDGGVLLRMRYISKEVSEALVSHISRQFDIDVNIVFGDIDVVEGSPLGGLVVVITGDRNNILAAIDYLKNRNIGIEVLAS